jgi:hypothetical protein
MDTPETRLFCNPLEKLAGQRWHEVYSYGEWDVSQMVRDHAGGLVHSSIHIRRKTGEASGIGSLFFKISEDIFVFGDLGCGEGLLSFWAATPELARSEYDAWRAKYLKKPNRKREPAYFHVLSVTAEGVETKPIPIVRRFPRTKPDLALHYGEDFPGWDAQFIRELKSHISGASILQGEPGTGKTTFIRHLINRLRRTHRFYYLPANQLEMLSAPHLVQFWIRESHDAEKIAKVMVVEDAEPLLVARGRDNHDQLSNFLNITDGLPGEFLKLHLICTINCKIDKLDPAVTRTGRLIAYRNFRRLTRAEAQRLALAKNLIIPVQQESYSLAEIYGEQRLGFEEVASRRVGFG